MPIMEEVDDLEPVVAKWTDFYAESGLTPSSGTVTRSEYLRTVAKTSRKRVWVRTDNYKALKAAGKLPVNPLLYEENIISGGGNVTFRRHNYDWRDEVTLVTTRNMLETPVVAYAATSGVPRRDAWTEVTNRLLSKARSNQWNAPIFLAEAGKTAEMVGKTAVRFVHMARALKRGRLGDFVGLMHPSASVNYSKRKDAWFDLRYGVDPKGAAAQAWLEYKYGWMPFVLDTHDAMMTLMDLVEEAREGRDRQLLRVMARYREIFEADGLETVSMTPNLACRTERVVTHTTRGWWEFTVNPEDIPSRIGLTNPLEWVWELTPLSFVADHLFRIGDYLSGFNDKMRFNHIRGNHSYKQTVTTRRSNWQSSDYLSTNGPPVSSSYTFVDSNPLIGMPEMELSQAFELQNALSPAHIATWLSLINQLAPRKG